MDKRTKHHNRLIDEKSPYLLQHADNPVDWYPWGEQAFEKARRENKPIFLSIGYSTCHWCHVMEHESFEDMEVAALMNEVFVSIKVDREERPDIDGIYMTVCQMMTGSGGWPLTIIMTPDKKPFFAATYIAKESRYGRIGMIELTQNVKKAWAERREELVSSAEGISVALSASTKTESGEKVGLKTLDEAYKNLSGSYDEVYGGFGSAPKFPTAHNFMFLLRYWRRNEEQHALQMVEKSLEQMRNGGIFDHLGGGFHRYSTDRKWLVPHFEKMLYDQAMLAMAYTEAFQATGRKKFEKTARGIIAYVIRDMTSPEGGFYSAEDADSEREEGKFYIWTIDEIRRTLGKNNARIAEKIFNITKSGNYSDEATGKATGRNILHRNKPLPTLAAELNMSPDKLEQRIDVLTKILFEVREKRVHPYKDDKILVDWNGLMIAALAKSGQVFDAPEYVDAARRAADFVLANMQDKQGRLRHRYRDGEAAVSGSVDDYAFFVWGLIELYETTFDVKYLRHALELNQTMLVHFWDKESGGLFFTADDSEELLIRKKEIYDGAIPSGNSVAMTNLLRLERMTADTGLEQKAEEISQAFARIVKRTPTGFTHFMVAVDFAEGPSYEIVIVGKPEAEETKKMLKALRAEFVPNKVVVFRQAGIESPEIVNLAKYTKDMTDINGKATAYVCIGYKCLLPTTDIAEMKESLNLD